MKTSALLLAATVLIAGCQAASTDARIGPPIADSIASAGHADAAGPPIQLLSFADTRRAGPAALPDPSIQAEVIYEDSASAIADSSEVSVAQSQAGAGGSPDNGFWISQLR